MLQPTKIFEDLDLVNPPPQGKIFPIETSKLICNEHRYERRHEIETETYICCTYLNLSNNLLNNGKLLLREALRKKKLQNL